MISQQSIIEALNLQPHPEGGFFKETYRSQGEIPKEDLPQMFNGKRNYATGIYFLISSDAFSAFHKVNQDEMWHFYLGSPITLHQINPKGDYQKIIIGSDIFSNQQLQYTVPGNCWFAAEVEAKNGFALVGCTVSPGFDFADFNLASRGELISTFPQHQTLIERLTRQ